MHNGIGLPVIFVLSNSSIQGLNESVERVGRVKQGSDLN